MSPGASDLAFPNLNTDLYSIKYDEAITAYQRTYDQVGEEPSDLFIEIEDIDSSNPPANMILLIDRVK